VKFDASLETELIGIHISPNPTLGQLTITLTSSAQNIRVVNAFGEAVSLAGTDSFSTNADNDLTLDISNQPPGYYYVLIPNYGNFLVLKV